MSCLSELHDEIALGAERVVRFLQGYFRSVGGKDFSDYSTKWTPYRVLSVVVKHLKLRTNIGRATSLGHRWYPIDVPLLLVHDSFMWNNTRVYSM